MLLIVKEHTACLLMTKNYVSDTISIAFILKKDFIVIQWSPVKHIHFCMANFQLSLGQQKLLFLIMLFTG